MVVRVGAEISSLEFLAYRNSFSTENIEFDKLLEFVFGLVLRVDDDGGGRRNDDNISAVAVFSFVNAEDVVGSIRVFDA